MRRDLSLLLDAGVLFADLKATALKQDRKLLKEVNLFDVYEGKKLPNGKKSYALSFTFQHPDKTLTDKVVDKTMQKIITAFGKGFNATLR
jgi:phenylalanyl-tRNA synthetase beta chain